MSAAAAIARLDEMIPLVERELRRAIDVEAAMETANDAIASGNLEGKSFEGALCYNTIANSLALHLALTLAKLFEFPRPRKGEAPSRRHNASDVASIPLVVRLLKQTQCRKALVERARGWNAIEMDFGRINAAAVERAIDNIVKSDKDFRGSKTNHIALRTLANFRNKFLAHTLLGSALKKHPLFNDLFLLVDLARSIVSEASLAVRGLDLDLEGVEARAKEAARAFWRPALSATISPARSRDE